MRSTCRDGASSRVQPRRFNEACATAGRRRLRSALAAAMVADLSAHPAAARSVGCLSFADLPRRIGGEEPAAR